MCSAIEKRQINLAQYDVLTDIGNLRKIYSYCEGGVEACRIELERMGNMVILTRCDEKDMEDYNNPPDRPPSYGQAYEKLSKRLANKEDRCFRLISR